MTQAHKLRLNSRVEIDAPDRMTITDKGLAVFEGPVLTRCAYRP